MKRLIEQLERGSLHEAVKDVLHSYTVKITLRELRNEGRVLKAKKFKGQRNKWVGSLLVDEGGDLHKGRLEISTTVLDEGPSGLRRNNVGMSFGDKFWPEGHLRGKIIEMAKKQAEAQGLYL